MEQETENITVEDLVTSADYSKEIEAIIQQNSDHLELSEQMLGELSQSNEFLEVRYLELSSSVDNINTLLLWFCGLFGLMCGLLLVLIFKK